MRITLNRRRNNRAQQEEDINALEDLKNSHEYLSFYDLGDLYYNVALSTDDLQKQRNYLEYSFLYFHAGHFLTEAARSKIRIASTLLIRRDNELTSIETTSPSFKKLPPGPFNSDSNEASGILQKAKENLATAKQDYDKLLLRAKCAYQMTLSDFHVREGKLEDAEAACRVGIELAQSVVPPYKQELFYIEERLENIRAIHEKLATAFEQLISLV